MLPQKSRKRNHPSQQKPSSGRSMGNDIFGCLSCSGGSSSNANVAWLRLTLACALFTVIAFLSAPKPEDLTTATLSAFLSMEEFGRFPTGHNSRRYRGQSPDYVHVFYHTYSGSTRGLRELAHSIVEDQVEQIGQASDALGDETKWILRYRSVGEEGVVKPFMVDPICLKYDNLECEYQGHIHEGHEETTLQQMQDFCIANPDETVAYMHSKGSFHSNSLNNVWRGPLTAGALHPSCIQALQPKNNSGTIEPAQCNVCGLQFYPLWNLMFPGNMFSAKCTYVTKLLPMVQYRSKMAEIVSETYLNSASVYPGDDPSESSGIWRHELYAEHFQQDRLGIFGLERYSNEQWIGSHPSVRPCDLSKHHSKLLPHLDKKAGEINDSVRNGLAELAPRTKLAAGRWFRFNRTLFGEITGWNDTADEMEQNLQPPTRPHEYFLTPGILYRFYKIYGIFPANNSWIWGYYPYALAFKRKIEEATRKDGSIDESLVW